MKLSITLPSLFPDLLSRAIASIHEHTAHLDHEILVVSPFEASGPNVRWIPEDQPRGNCHAHNEAARHATGDLVLAMCDDHAPMARWADEFLAFFTEREKGHEIYVCGLNIHCGPVGTAFGIYYPYFPVLRRRSIERIGGYYRPQFAAHFGDVDLGMRIWRSGGRCEYCYDARIAPIRDETSNAPESPHKSQAKYRDMETFLREWRPIYGEDWGPCENIRDFNLDIPGRFFKDFLVDHTIYDNRPAFRDKVMAFYKTLPNDSIMRW
ncbi:hypothetical protein CCP2SC5_340013 [Azospirillaceae bacterium]